MDTQDGRVLFPRAQASAVGYVGYEYGLGGNALPFKSSLASTDDVFELPLFRVPAHDCTRTISEDPI